MKIFILVAFSLMLIMLQRKQIPCKQPALLVVLVSIFKTGSLNAYTQHGNYYGFYFERIEMCVTKNKIFSKLNQI